MKQVFRLALGDVGPAKRGQGTLCGSEAEPVRDTVSRRFEAELRCQPPWVGWATGDRLRQLNGTLAVWSRPHQQQFEVQTRAEPRTGVARGMSAGNRS